MDGSNFDRQGENMGDVVAERAPRSAQLMEPMLKFQKATIGVFLVSIIDAQLVIV